MPDLGQYAGAVLSAYAVSLVLIGGLIVHSLMRARRAEAALRKAEEQAGRRHV